ncbi:excinuclease ABC subunit UvrC [Geitlerinema sp. PCC 9228]|jgi:excinuclease ABC subunit C|uniref:excinuclease ABC subunit UvrC n=1 Tax=Geitlerinema sp. PCC 9228 TaxID=111611 RepID=UPI0008F9DF43|nr:excinuclease ABC subunit UvrC [Geitlerinema sp. PCC 9228]
MRGTQTEFSPLIEDRERLESRLREIPPVPGVYIMRDGENRILYIGKSKKLRSRVRSYFSPSQQLSDRIQLMVRQVADIEFIVTDTEEESLILEANLIKQHQPYFNVLLKDDKKYPYLCITWSETYPRIFATRKRRRQNPQDRYYGPYVDAHQLYSTLNLLKRIFPLRQRPKPLFKDRPCLNYDIGRCPGVCQQLISPSEYREIVQRVAMVFQGRTEELVNSLQKQMETAAAAQNFEVAARLRDQIRGLQKLGVDRKVTLPDDRVSRDAIAIASDDQRACIQLFQFRAGQLVGRLGFLANAGEAGEICSRVLSEHYRDVDAVEIPTEIVVETDLPDREMLAAWLGSRKGKQVSFVVPQRQVRNGGNNRGSVLAMVKQNAEYELQRLQRMSDRNTAALQDVAEILDLPKVPHRIEGYDISHVQGSDAVASRVVFLDGLPANQQYRHYKIKNPNVQGGHSDDFASMAEVIQRRFRQYRDMDVEMSHPDDFPDLVLIDGGKGQLSAAVDVLQQMNLLQHLRVVGLAKQREEIFLPGESLPLETDAEQPGVQLLRRLRDEAHRFAVSFHRSRRDKRMKRSLLEDIPGLGFQRQKQLLAHFRSVDYIRIATPEQLAEAPGIGPHLAKQIYDYFHPDAS